MKLLIIPNGTRKESLDFGARLAELLIEKKQKTAVLPEFKDIFEKEYSIKTEKEYKDSDIAVVLGGDGTVLRYARVLHGLEIPIWAVNYGHLGYLTDCDHDEAFGFVDRLLAGDYETENRVVIAGRIRSGDRMNSFVAFNEVVAYRARLLRALKIDLFIDRKFIQTIHADGLIVSTPTGSTAYNWSAGGPVMLPESENMAITAIAQSLYSIPSMVTSADSVVSFQVHYPSTEGNNESEKPVLTLDSLEKIPLRDGDAIDIYRDRTPLMLIRVKNLDFYQTLQRKLSFDTGDY